MAKRPGKDGAFNKLEAYTQNYGTLATPEAMQQLHAVDFEEGKSDPVFAEVVELEWYTVDENECDVAQETRAVDMTYIFQRHTKEVRTSWSSFNQCLMSDNQEITTVGYMPIIQAPAHELDTLNTVVRRCMYIAAQLG